MLWRPHNRHGSLLPPQLPSGLVNVWWRTLLVMLRARSRVRRGKGLGVLDVSRVRLTTMPTDLDILGHMNNGRYLSLMDLGRWDWLIRSGLLGAMQRHKWYAVVSSQTVSYRKSLKPWQRFTIESRVLGHDDKTMFLEHRCVVQGEIYARAVVGARILYRTGGHVPHETVFAAVGRPDDAPELPSWVGEWVAASALPSARAAAPSLWG